MARADSKGRSITDLPHIRLYDWMLKSPAWRSLTVYSRCLYLEMKRRYNGSNNGNIIMSFREAMELIGCSNLPIRSAFRELIQKGFIKTIQKGSFDWKLHIEGKGRASTWLLTEHNADFPTPSISASKDFMKWKPTEKAAKPKKKTRCDEITPLVLADTTMDSGMVVADTTMRVSCYHHDEQNQGVDGGTSYHTNNIPYIGEKNGFQQLATTSLLESLNSRGWNKPGREQPIKRQESEPGDYSNFTLEKKEGLA